MARFLKHIGCDRCGSSDANAVYEDGSQFCFSCRKPTSSKVSPYALLHANSDSQMETTKKVVLPEDANSNYSERAVSWAGKYEISVLQLLASGVVYSKKREQLIFTFTDELGELLAYQARNLNAVSKAKRYYTCGDVNNLLPIYHFRFPLPNGSNHRRLVLVEDCLSAIKISYTEGLGASAMPLLRSGINKNKLSKLRRSYDVLDVFLDPDMWHSSLEIAGRAQLLGFKARPIQADCDPKELSYEQLKDMLK